MQLTSVLLLVSSALCAAVCAGTLTWAAKRQSEDEALVIARFRAAAGRGNESPPQRERGRLQLWWEAELRRAGIEMSPRMSALCTAALPMLLLLAFAMAGLLGVIVAFLGGAVLAWSALHWRIERRRAELLGELPHTLEHVSRAVATGSSLPQAFSVATQEAEGPMRELLDRVARQTHVGVPLEESFEQAAVVWGLRELEMLAFTVRVSQQYGGSVRSALARIVAAVRLREKSSRELRALTAETRLSAWILGCLPLSIGAYVSIVNPDYVGHLVDDPAGRVLLWIALGLQALGALVIWRMVRAI